jgi:hypothetical protein
MQFTRDCAARAHQGVWRISDTCVVCPLHVRRALKLCGGGSQLRLSKAVHFGALLERFSEGESEDRDEPDPLGGSPLPHHAADTNAADRRRKGTPTRRSDAYRDGRRGARSQVARGRAARRGHSVRGWRVARSPRRKAGRCEGRSFAERAEAVPMLARE